MVCALLGCGVKYASKRKARRVGRWIVQANHPVRLRSNSQRTSSRLDYTGHSLALVSPVPNPWADEGRIYAPLSITGVGNNTLVLSSAYHIEDGTVRAQQHPPLASIIRGVGRFKEDHLSHIHIILQQHAEVIFCAASSESKNDMPRSGMIFDVQRIES